MEKIISFLKLIDDNYIISLSNKGYLKRSRKNYPKTEINITSKEPLTLSVGENVVIFNGATADSIECNCSDSKFCRHRIMAIFHLQENFLSDSDTEETPKELTEDTYKELLEFDIDKLKKYFTTKLFNQGIKYSLKAEIRYQLTNRALLFTIKDKFSDVTIDVSFLSISPIDNLICSNRACKGKKCIHQVASFLFYLKEKNIINSDDLTKIIQKEILPIDESHLLEIENLLYEILNTGLSKVTTLTTKRLRKLGIKLHYSVPAFEKLLYSIEREIELFLNKSSSFSISRFRDRIIKILRLIRVYRNNPNDYNFLNDLTKLRSEYQDAELTLLGLGKEYIETPEMAMLKIYFISENNQFFTRTLFFSLKQGGDYRNARNSLLHQSIWEQSIDLLINKSFTIKKTKINNEHVISSLGVINFNFKISLKDRAVFTNFKELKESFNLFRRENNLLSVNYKPFYSLVEVYEYGEVVFDFDTQDIKIEIFDEKNNRIFLRFKYSDYPKRYIKERKKQFDDIMNLFKSTKEKPLILFGIPYFEDEIFYFKAISLYYENIDKFFSVNLDGIKGKIAKNQ